GVAAEEQDVDMGAVGPRGVGGSLGRRFGGGEHAGQRAVQGDGGADDERERHDERGAQDGDQYRAYGPGPPAFGARPGELPGPDDDARPQGGEGYGADGDRFHPVGLGSQPRLPGQVAAQLVEGRTGGGGEQEESSEDAGSCGAFPSAQVGERAEERRGGQEG